MLPECTLLYGTQSAIGTIGSTIHQCDKPASVINSHALGSLGLQYEFNYECNVQPSHY